MSISKNNIPAFKAHEKLLGIFTVNDKDYRIYTGLNTIGRNRNCIVNIRNPNVSHLHAVIIAIDEDQQYISDLGSSNGTYIDGIQLIPLKLYPIDFECKITLANLRTKYVHYDMEKSLELDQSPNSSQSIYMNLTQAIQDNVTKNAGNTQGMKTQPDPVTDNETIEKTTTIALSQMVTQQDSITKNIPENEDSTNHMQNDDKSNDSIDYVVEARSQIENDKNGSTFEDNSVVEVDTSKKSVYSLSDDEDLDFLMQKKKVKKLSSDEDDETDTEEKSDGNQTGNNGLDDTNIIPATQEIPPIGGSKVNYFENITKMASDTTNDKETTNTEKSPEPEDSTINADLNNEKSSMDPTLNDTPEISLNITNSVLTGDIVNETDLEFQTQQNLTTKQTNENVNNKTVDEIDTNANIEKNSEEDKNDNNPPTELENNTPVETDPKEDHVEKILQQSFSDIQSNNFKRKSDEMNMLSTQDVLKHLEEPNVSTEELNEDNNPKSDEDILENGVPTETPSKSQLETQDDISNILKEMEVQNEAEKITWHSTPGIQSDDSKRISEVLGMLSTQEVVSHLEGSDESYSSSKSSNISNKEPSSDLEPKKPDDHDSGQIFKTPISKIKYPRNKKLTKLEDKKSISSSDIEDIIEDSFPNLKSNDESYRIIPPENILQTQDVVKILEDSPKKLKEKEISVENENKLPRLLTCTVQVTNLSLPINSPKKADSDSDEDFEVSNISPNSKTVKNKGGKKQRKSRKSVTKDEPKSIPEILSNRPQRKTSNLNEEQKLEDNPKSNDDEISNKKSDRKRNTIALDHNEPRRKSRRLSANSRQERRTKMVERSPEIIVSTRNTRNRKKVTETTSSEDESSIFQSTKRLKKQKVVFTLINDPELESIILELGGNIVDNVYDCTVLVTNVVKRTQKLLEAIGLNRPICSGKWLEECEKARAFLDPWKFILIDEEAEEKWDFSLRESLYRSKLSALWQDYTFQILTTYAHDVLKAAINACGGNCVTKFTKNSVNKLVVVATTNESNKYQKIVKLHKKVIVVEPEAIFDGALRQETRFEKYLLE